MRIVRLLALAFVVLVAGLSVNPAKPASALGPHPNYGQTWLCAYVSPDGGGWANRGVCAKTKSDADQLCSNMCEAAWRNAPQEGNCVPSAIGDYCFPPPAHDCRPGIGAGGLLEGADCVIYPVLG